MTTPDGHPGSSGPSWWETPGSLCAALLRLDGQVGLVVHTERHVVEPATVVSDDMARHLGRLLEEMGLGAGDGAPSRSGRAPGFERVKPSFTRVPDKRAIE